MSAEEWVLKFAVTPLGTAIDVACVRWLGHSLVSALFARSTGVEYNPPLLLVATGRRSGRKRPVVVPFFPAGPGRIAVVGSKGGAPKDPYWVENLRAEPQAEVHLARRRRRVRARVAEGAERAELWDAITKRAAVYLDYETRAAGQREIPVVVLESPDGPLP